MDELAKGEDQDDGYPPEEGFQLYTLKRRNKKKLKTLDLSLVHSSLDYEVFISEHKRCGQYLYKTSS